MDCFYAAVEMRDRPELAGKPLAVGGSRSGRGVLTTANYEARAYGCRSAMPTAIALRHCPQLRLVPVDMAKYKQESQYIQAIFARYTDLIEPLSLDEAFLDVTAASQLATRIATDIRQTIWRERELTASAGISVNKFVAKVASDWRKPNGQYVVKPHQVDAFVANLPVGKIFGVGKVTEDKLHQMGLKTCQDLRALPEHTLTQHFGKFGRRLYELCRGIDDRPVRVNRQRKSLSVERTFSGDLADLQSLSQRLPELLLELERRWSKAAAQYQFKGLVLKLKFHDFQLTTASCTAAYEWDREALHKDFQELLTKAWQRGQKPARLLGLGLQTFARDQSAPLQTQLPML
nr:DNA polymerase IV [Oceanococcus sp. HetDA_MAG_MS8]